MTSIVAFSMWLEIELSVNMDEKSTEISYPTNLRM